MKKFFPLVCRNSSKKLHSPAPWNNGHDSNGNILLFQNEEETGENRNAEYIANRRMLDAAPEMFAALEDLIKIVPVMCEWANRNPDVDLDADAELFDARAAIAKIKWDYLL